MALETNVGLRNQVMYSIFVRQYSAEGTFRRVLEDLGRIRALGVDVIWLMPIHPVGEAKRKGSLGSPYAIRDYRVVNPEFGTLDDFRQLVDGIHAHGMKCIIDVVYNHTSPDSWLAQNHPEWFYHKPDGSFGNKNGDWSDIIDLDYANPGLWEYQIETLKQWAAIVDGFRCDVAPLVPLAFWQRARREVEAVRPGCLWLSESVEPAYIAFNRGAGIPCLSDSEIFQAFDLSYEYDVHPDYLDYLAGKTPLSAYAAAVSRQETIYPENYVKLRFLENHDQRRAAFLIPDERARRSWTAFLYFQKGMTLLYNGQERSAVNRPSLFDKDPVEWDGADIAPLLQKLYAIKQDPIFAAGSYCVRAAGSDILLAEYRQGGRRMIGVFSTKGAAAPVSVSVPDGWYEDRISGRRIQADGGFVSCSGEPLIFAAEE